MLKLTGSLTFCATICLLFVAASATGNVCGGFPSGVTIPGIQVADGPIFPPDPWDVADGPIFPPDPWDVADGPIFPPDPWDRG